jgi:hypothetical protein
MGNGLMVGSFQCCWAPILQYPRLLKVVLYHENIISTLTLFMWTLPLEIAYRSAAFVTLLFLSIALLATIWFSASRISPVILSLWFSASSGLTQAPMLDAFVAIAMPNFLALQFANILLIMDPTWLPPPLVVSCQMAWWNLIGKLWSTSSGLT